MAVIEKGRKMSRIKVLNIQTLSYSGTTWLNLLLGSHPETFAFGPPHRAWALRDKKFEGACLIHGPECEFWTRFGNKWDGSENFFVALAEESGKRIFLMDNAPQDFINETMSHPDVDLLHGRYVRDGRAITASFARKMKDHGVNYIDSIKPEGWFYHSFQAIPLLDTLKSLGHLVIHYEDAVNNQAMFLKTAGDFLGITYSEDTYRFWEWDHHITSGNYGPMAMIRLHQGLPIANFESADVYRAQLERLKENPTSAFSDDRWKSQLSREELYWFDQLLGGKNEQLGYARDVFSQEEIDSFTTGKGSVAGTGAAPSIENVVSEQTIAEDASPQSPAAEVLPPLDLGSLNFTKPLKIHLCHSWVDSSYYTHFRNLIASLGFPDGSIEVVTHLEHGVEPPLGQPKAIAELSKRICEQVSSADLVLLPAYLVAWRRYWAVAQANQARRCKIPVWTLQGFAPLTCEAIASADLVVAEGSHDLATRLAAFVTERASSHA